LSFNLDTNGNIVWAKEASDFNEEPNLNDGDMYTPVFAVNYGQQNQNYFKNIKLDQREFAETMESLQIIEELSQTGDKSKPTYVGNNLFEVYQTRAYSAEVEMMGSAMIQPMMYFQLSNIPMFRGAYLIYKVSHKITPHSMVTTFKGNRAKKTKTPLLDKATMYMSLIGTQTGGAPISSRSTVSGTFPPIVQTIIENDGRNGSVISGNITVKAIPFDKLKAVGDPFNKKNLKDENLLLTEAVEPLINMLNDWTDWMSTNGFKGVSSGNKKLYTYITSIFRDTAKQEDVKRQKIAEGRPKEAATPGISPHGWAMAVDLQFFKKNGELIDNKNSVANKSFDINVNPAIKWLYDNSYKYGWVLPYSLRDGAGTEEHWHWEYHGKSAKCLVEKNPNVYGYKMDTSGTIKDFVKNPKDSSGKEAVYTGCDYRYIKMADGSDDGGSVPSKAPNLKCGKASANDVNSVYPRSKKWLSGPAEVIVKQTNGPKVSVKKTDFPQVKKETTIVTPQEYIKAAESIIDKLAPNATNKQKKLILVSAFAISKSEQGAGDGFRGFNNNISGIESDGFKVFNKSDVNGYVVIPEGGTGITKKYFSFSNLSAGLVPLISKIMERNMFDTGGGANEWAWRYFRDWNGFGARTL
ncbi:MAG: M15 family metallopeptidase, partial [Methanobacterium sp.]